MHVLASRHRKLRWAGVVLGAPVIVVAMAAPALADVTSVGGGAFGASVNVKPLHAALVTAGPISTVTLPAGGSATPITAHVLNADVPHYLSASVLDASTQGTLGSSGGTQSSAKVTGVNLGSGDVTATAVSSSCQSSDTGSIGTTLTQISILGSTPVNISPSPNTSVTLVGIGTLIENEQIKNDSSGHTEITVNALHLKLDGLLGTGDIIVAQSHCIAAGPDVLIPIGAVGGLGLAGALGVAFVGRQVWHRRRRGAPQSA